MRRLHWRVSDKPQQPRTVIVERLVAPCEGTTQVSPLASMASLDDRPNDNVHDPSDIGTLPYSDVVRTRIVSTVYRYPVTPAYHRTLPGALLRVLLEGTPQHPGSLPWKAGMTAQSAYFVAILIAAATPSAASRSGSSNRWAYRAVVSAWVWPSTLPIVRSEWPAEAMKLA
jgi:hypothetical protein